MSEGEQVGRSAAKEENITYLSFSSEVSQTTTEALLGTCADLANKGADTVHLLLSTPGGSVLNGITIYNVLRMVSR